MINKIENTGPAFGMGKLYVSKELMPKYLEYIHQQGDKTPAGIKQFNRILKKTKNVDLYYNENRFDIRNKEGDIVGAVHDFTTESYKDACLRIAKEPPHIYPKFIEDITLFFYKKYVNFYAKFINPIVNLPIGMVNALEEALIRDKAITKHHDRPLIGIVRNKY